MAVWRKAVFLGGFVLGMGLSAAMAAEPNGPAIPVQVLAEEAWPHMTASQRKIVDVIARDHYVFGTTPDQKRRISGSTQGEYEDLPEWRKAPFRGIALRQLGHVTEDFSKSAI